MGSIPTAAFPLTAADGNRLRIAALSDSVVGLLSTAVTRRHLLRRIPNHARQAVTNGLKESIKYAEQNLYARAKYLVGDRDPREHEFSVQLRAFDAAKTGSGLGVPALLALCSALLEKNLKGGLVVVGALNLGGSIDPIHNAVSVAEVAAANCLRQEPDGQASPRRKPWINCIRTVAVRAACGASASKPVDSCGKGVLWHLRGAGIEPEVRKSACIGEQPTVTVYDNKRRQRAGYSNGKSRIG